MIHVIFILLLIIFSLIIFITIKRKKREWTLAATWIMAITAVTAVIINMHYSREQLKNIEKSLDLSKDFFEKQINEMEKATRLDWRPFLHLEHLDVKSNLKIGPGQYAKVDTLPFLLREYAEEGKKYEVYVAEEALSIELDRKIKYWNVGKTPLRIIGSLDTTLTEDSWINFKKSEKALIKAIKESNARSKWDVDFVVMPSDTIVSQKVRISRNYIPISTLNLKEGYRNKIFLYLVSYYEYKDPFGYDYNTILVDHVDFHVEQKGDTTTFSGPHNKTLEKYRWDVGIE